MYICNACPRKCGIDRENKTGVCGVSVGYRVARAALHYWEEPCISGTRGSGTVFFSGCSLKCVFCQNYQISRGCYGKEISEERLVEIFGELKEQGAHNINLVNPTHYALQLADTLTKYKPDIPVVYNTGGYDSVDSLKRLEGLADIYLTDMKYVSPKVAKKYSRAEDYFEIASAAALEMLRQTGEAVFDSDGIMQKGVIVRHLVLPGNISQAMQVLDWISANMPPDTVVSLMSQYTPCGDLSEYPTINRRLSEREYDMVLDYADRLGLENAYIQELDSSKEEYIPPFDLSGV